MNGQNDDILLPLASLKSKSQTQNFIGVFTNAERKYKVVQKKENIRKKMIRESVTN